MFSRDLRGTLAWREGSEILSHGRRISACLSARRIPIKSVVPAMLLPFEPCDIVFVYSRPSSTFFCRDPLRQSCLRRRRHPYGTKASWSGTTTVGEGRLGNTKFDSRIFTPVTDQCLTHLVLLCPSHHSQQDDQTTIPIIKTTDSIEKPKGDTNWKSLETLSLDYHERATC